MLARAERVAPGFDPGVAEAALQGLLAIRKTLSPKLFYDDEGCRLFGEITRLPEYYPTRTELALLHDIAPEFGAGGPLRQRPDRIRRQRRDQGGNPAGRLR